MHNSPCPQTRPLALVVDDDPAIREVYSLALGEMGYDVQSAGDGREAFELALANSYSLALIDQRMHGLTGTEFIRAIRRSRKNELRVVLISGGRGLRQQALESGADDYLEKPFEIDELLAVIERFHPTQNSEQLSHPA